METASRALRGLLLRTGLRVALFSGVFLVLCWLSLSLGVLGSRGLDLPFLVYLWEVRQVLMDDFEKCLWKERLGQT